MTRFLKNKTFIIFCNHNNLINNNGFIYFLVFSVSSFRIKVPAAIPTELPLLLQIDNTKKLPYKESNFELFATKTKKSTKQHKIAL